MKVINPHDKFFKEAQGDKENAKELIQAVFPKELLEKLDLDSLEADKNSYIDDELKEYFTKDGKKLPQGWDCLYN